MGKKEASVVTKIAMFSALAVIFDYVMKFSGLKIIFPWLPFLKFDFTGIPIMLSLFIIGLNGAATTSAAVFLAILVRSGELIGASMKAIAEFSTALGFYFGSRILRNKIRLSRILSYTLGCITRTLIMFLLTIPVLNLYYGSLGVALALSPLVAIFNLIHGVISISGGDLIYVTLKWRVPSLIFKRTKRGSSV